jgi:hypothetical protein
VKEYNVIITDAKPAPDARAGMPVPDEDGSVDAYVVLMIIHLTNSRAA